MYIFKLSCGSSAGGRTTKLTGAFIADSIYKSFFMPLPDCFHDQFPHLRSLAQRMGMHTVAALLLACKYLAFDVTYPSISSALYLQTPSPSSQISPLHSQTQPLHPIGTILGLMSSQKVVQRTVNRMRF